MQSPQSECESVLTNYDNEHRPTLAYPQFFVPPPPDHPPSDMEGDSPGAASRAQRSLASHLSYQAPPHLVQYSPQVRPHQNNYMNCTAKPYSHGTLPRTDSRRAGAHATSGRQPHHSGSAQYADGGAYPVGAGLRTNPRESPLYAPASGSLRGSDASKMGSRDCNSPQAMSEPEVGPTPPVRGMSLGVTPSGSDPHRHFSDTETPLQQRLHTRSALEQPPSPAPQDACDPVMDRGIQSSLPSLVSEQHRDCASPSASEIIISESDGEQGRMSPCETDALFAGKTRAASLVAVMTSLKVFSLPGSADDDDVTSSDDSFDADVDDVTRPQSNMFRSHTQSVAKHMGLTVLDGANGGREKGANSDQLTTLHYILTVTDVTPSLHVSVKRHKKARPSNKRASSPYSTDSNYSAVTSPHAHKAQGRRRAGGDAQVRPVNRAASAVSASQSHGRKQPPPIRSKPQLPHNGA